MAVTYTTAVKNARLDAVVTQIGSAGVLEIGTTSMGTVLDTIALGNPAGTTSGGILTFSFCSSIYTIHEVFTVIGCDQVVFCSIPNARYLNESDP